MITFTVPCIPVAQPRQRMRVIALPGRQPFAQNYTPKNDPVNAFKAAVQQAAVKVHSAAPLDGPLACFIEFVLPRPGSIPKREGTGRRWRDKKPDAENLAKSVLDALTGLVWRDDAQVAWLLVQKTEAALEEQASVAVTIERLPVYSFVPVVVGEKGLQGSLFDTHA